jgi:Zn-dependent protease
MKFKGISILRIGGTEIILDYSWLVILVLTAYAMAVDYLPNIHAHYTAPQYWLMGGISAFLLFASILLHELAHSFVAMKKGIKVTSIRLLVFGGISQAASEPKTGKDEFLIALAGPALSASLGVFFLTMHSYFLFSGSNSPVIGISWCLGLANIAITALNMIPGFPLDGGRILRAFLWDRWNDLGRATQVVSRIGSSFALLLIVLGIVQFLVTQSFIAGLWLVFIGLFMKQSALGSAHSALLRRALSGVKIRQIMTERLVTVDWLLSIDELIHKYIYKHQFTNFPVFNRDEFVGMVNIEGVKTISKELWGFKQVRDIMTPAELTRSLKPADDASEILSQMIAEDVAIMPVMEEGKLVGMISRDDIINFFKIKSDLDAA